MTLLSENLCQGEDGVWYPVGGAVASVHYPDDGHAGCFQVEEQSFWFAHRNACILAAIERFPPPGRIFDVGGGNGFVSLALQGAGHDVALVEPGPQGIAHARNRGLEHLVCASLEEARFHPASLPAVGLFDVVEHVDDDQGFLANIHSLLVPGGRLYATVPAYRWLWSPDDDFAGHRRRYRLSSLRSVLTRAGFRTDFATYFFWPLPGPIFLARTVPGKLRAWARLPPRSGLVDHRSPSGAGGRLLGRTLAAELARIRAGQFLPFGASILVVASRVD